MKCKKCLDAVLEWIDSRWGRRLRHEDKAPLEEPDGKPVLLDIDDLKPGDVLLVYTDPTALSVSWWVRQLAGGWYSHAAFFDGATIVEAYKKGGVSETPIGERIRRSHYVDVFRFVSDDDEEMGTPGWPPDPVAEAVSRYLGSPFGTNDLLFGTMIAITRPIDLPGGLEAHFRDFLDRAMNAIQDFVSSEAEEHITCSELVYRGFSDPPPPPHYRLTIDMTHKGFDTDVLNPLPWVLRPGAEGAAGGLEPETFERLQEVARRYVALKERSGWQQIPEEALLVGGEARTGLDAVADYVSPDDLCRSPNLREIGRADKDGFWGP